MQHIQRRAREASDLNAVTVTHNWYLIIDILFMWINIKTSDL